MLPFDINLAKAGREVVTRDGNPVRILCYDRKDEDFPIIALVDCGEYETQHSFTINGSLNRHGESKFDLFIKGNTKSGWVNLYKDAYMPRTSPVRWCSNTYATKEKALEEVKYKEYPSNYVTTIEIHWEEP